MAQDGAYAWGPITEAIKGSLLVRFFRPGETQKAAGRELLRLSFEMNKNTQKPERVIRRAGKVYGNGPKISDQMLEQMIGIHVIQASEISGLRVGGYDDNGGEYAIPPTSNGARYLKELKKNKKAWEMFFEAWNVPQEKQDKFYDFLDNQNVKMHAPIEFEGEVW